MKELDRYEIIDIERPFYFLCGPNINNSKKRNVLSSFLKKKYERQKIRPFPIIVDRIFDTPLIEKHKLNLVLLEEIVAATSLKTYIFLDSLSTAYELGLFKNSKSNNSIRILVESTFNSRERRIIGEYILKSIGEDSFLKYEAEHTGEEYLEYFEFDNGIISKSIEECIEKEMCDYEKEIQRITLIVGENDGNPNGIFIKQKGNKLKVTFSLKSLFYMMQAFVRSIGLSHIQL